MFEYFAVSVLSILLVGIFYRNKYSLALSFLILTVFFAIRYEFGPDYPEYLRHFYLSIDGDLQDALYYDRFEDGWVILCRLCKPIGFFGMVIVLTVFENLVLYYLFKKYVPPKWYWLALFCYLFSTTLCLTGLSMMRQFLAMCVCLLAFDLAVRKKIIFSLALVFLAGQFHTSALVCIPVCFIGLLKDFRMTRKSSFWMMGILIGFNLIAVYLFGNVLADFILNSTFSVYENRFEEEYVAHIGITTFLEYILFVTILLNVTKQDRANRLFVLIFIMSQVIDAFKPMAPLISRVGLYFSILLPICMTNAIVKIENQWKYYILSLLLLLKLYGYFSFVGGPGWGRCFLNYTTIFSVNWM